VIPGKKYSPEDFLEIAWRRRWLIVTPFVAVAVGTFIWAYTLPDRYRSTAVVLVVPPQVPANYVRPTVTEPLDRRLDKMQKEILSSTRLQGMIEEFGLYPELRKERLMDEVVAQMRRDIVVVPAKTRRREDPGSFQVSYDSPNPKIAMQVADRIASLFLRANLEARTLQADSTAQFLDTQLSAARQKLRDHEARLEAFRRTNAGRLPTQVASNLQVMKSAQEQLAAVSLSISQDRDRQLVIERTIADEMALATTPVPGPISSDGTPAKSAPVTAAGQLAEAEGQLAALRLRLKETHPDIRTLKRRIEELKQRAAEEALQQPVSGAPMAIASNPADLARQKRIAGLRAEFESLDRRMAGKREQANQLEATIADYRVRIEAAPRLESELAQLMRDYDTLDKTYSSLLLKSQDAQLAANLEERQVSEVFKIVEGARMPERPTSPDRMRLNLMGALAGLGVGFALAALLEYRDRSLRTEDDVILTLALPVLALVPTMVTRVERQRRQRRRLVLASSSVVLVLACAAIIAWKFEVLSALMR
jgi:polysaccharide chain length determinant protein (PEP-CTERM system associated)